MYAVQQRGRASHPRAYCHTHPALPWSSGAPRRVIPHPTEKPPSGLSSPQGTTGVSGKCQKTDLTQQLDSPPVPRRAEGTKEVARVPNRAPCQRHRRAPDKKMLRRALADATERTRPKGR
eukprot:67029-Alexandrium_andersonii.AAC.1